MKLPRLTTLLAVVLFTAAAGFSAPPASAAAAWSHTTHLPGAREKGAGATIGTKVFALGGWTGSGLSASGEYLRQSDQTWHSIANFPGPARQWLASAVLGGKLYVVGGSYYDGSVWVNDPELDVFNPKAGTWKVLAPLPESLYGVAAVGYGGKIYTFGGSDHPTDFNGAVASVYAYTPSSDTWKPMASMPTPRAVAGAVVVGKRILVLGGQGQDSYPVAVNEQYTPATNHWKTLNSMHLARAGSAVGLVGSKVVVAGGFNWSYGLNGYPAMNQVEVYNPSTDLWKAGPSLPSARYDSLSAVEGGRLYAMGGDMQSNNDTTSTVYVMTP